VVLCSGKVYYDLAQRRAELKLEQKVALLRLEQAEKALNGEGHLVAGEATLTPRKPDWATF